MIKFWVSVQSALLYIKIRNSKNFTDLKKKKINECPLIFSFFLTLFVERNIIYYYIQI